MHDLRVSVVYDSGYAPSVPSCGILKVFPILDNTHPIKIGIRVAGTHTNNCKTQDLTMTHLVFDTVEKAQKFCDEAMPCFENDDTEAYRALQEKMLEAGDMKSIGSFYWRQT